MAEHNGMPRLGNDRSVDDDYEEVVAYPAPAQPHYQDYHEDSTTMDPSDIWREFESARSSAEYHLDDLEALPKYSLDAARISVHHLRLAFEEDIGLVDDESRNVLKKSRFNFLKWEFAYL
ncbi:unnamed protein product [Parascedosporium putredinis]|uniref:Uncharacterized protein n=1 Tax=Parascedosporium putredinis TaxID=1442378 RepID=A0A9P1H4S2_9PEZI|nr:unnamed protein product [Parascedosporium putredinis]CAI7996935.1 unnamed protein product [Parascedosporium putredinis]